MAASRPEIVDALVDPHPYTFEPSEAREALAPKVDAVLDDERIPVLSAERLCGYPDAGGYDAPEIARRLEATFPDAKIWVSLREQVDAIVSMYKQHLKSGGTTPVETYLDPPNRNKVPQFYPEHFAYHHLVGDYLERFSENRVLVTLFEDFKQDASTVTSQIAEFIGVEDSVPGSIADRTVNPSLSDTSCRLLRLVNRFFEAPVYHRYPLLPLPGQTAAKRWLARLDETFDLTGDQDRVHAAVADWCGDRFAESNRRLEKMLGMDLADRGYIR